MDYLWEWTSEGVGRIYFIYLFIKNWVTASNKQKRVIEKINRTLRESLFYDIFFMKPTHIVKLGVIKWIYWYYVIVWIIFSALDKITFWLKIYLSTSQQKNSKHNCLSGNKIIDLQSWFKLIDALSVVGWRVF